MDGIRNVFLEILKFEHLSKGVVFSWPNTAVDQDWGKAILFRFRDWKWNFFHIYVNKEFCLFSNCLKNHLQKFLSFHTPLQ